MTDTNSSNLKLKREVSKRMAEIEGHVFTRFYDDDRYPALKSRVYVKATLYCETDGEYEGEEWYSPFNHSTIYSQIEKHNLCVDARKDIVTVKFKCGDKIKSIKNKSQSLAILLAVIAKVDDYKLTK